MQGAAGDIDLERRYASLPPPSWVRGKQSLMKYNISSLPFFGPISKQNLHNFMLFYQVRPTVARKMPIADQDRMTFD